MNKYSLLLFFSLLFCTALSAQQEARDVRRGNRLYHKDDYVNAEVEYRRGLEKNDKSFSSTYNLGNSLFRQEKYEEAAKQYGQAVNLAGDDKKRKAACYHNMGNAMLKAGQIEQSIVAYKQALRNVPTDDDTRYNLALAQALLQQQQQQ
ncbi:MAG: tetratricopeptide repeat protein, partial [Bacteroidales bacterium]|nr:tetratricopeptide repeat protein [Bacteroidales bacterium]